jgi:uncharacterized membrane protein
MTIGMIAFWALLVYAVVRLVRGRPAASCEQASPPEAPDQILKRRLAQGEISIEESNARARQGQPGPGWREYSPSSIAKSDAEDVA